MPPDHAPRPPRTAVRGRWKQFLRNTAYRLLPTAYRLLPTGYCLPATAYRLLPTAYCLLPTAYCLPPTASRSGGVQLRHGGDEGAESVAEAVAGLCGEAFQPVAEHRQGATQVLPDPPRAE